MLVIKFGGAALKNISGFVRAATIIAERKKEFEKIVVVVSAMGKMTDRLLGLAKRVSSNPPKREQDMLVSVGERVSMALLAMVFAEQGCEAISFTGSQAGIITTEEHSDAKIIDVRPKRIIPHLEKGKIIVVAGFQGVSSSGEITTLGRGGSDTTAVALGVALGADRVEFYKDVEGIFEQDPKRHPEAKKLSTLSYKEALTVIMGAERPVLHPRAVMLAEKNQMPLYVCSFLQEGQGSRIQGNVIREEEAAMGVCYEHNT